MQIPFKDKQIHVEVYGEGRPIVLLNGVMMVTKSWTPFVEALSKNNKLILLDFLDQGQSSPAAESYNVETQADVVRAVLDGLKLENANISGISYGSFVATQFALSYPEKTEKLILFNCAAWCSPWLRDIGKSWDAAKGTPEGFYYAAMPIIYSQGFYNNKQEWLGTRKDLLTQYVFNDPEFFVSLNRRMESAHDHDVRARLGELKMKTLIVGSADDYLMPLFEQKYIHERVPNSDFVVMEDCGHASMYEKPDVFTTLLTGFVNTESVKI